MIDGPADDGPFAYAGSEPKRQINTGPPNSDRARALPKDPNPLPQFQKGSFISAHPLWRHGPGVDHAPHRVAVAVAEPAPRRIHFADPPPPAVIVPDPALPRDADPAPPPVAFTDPAPLRVSFADPALPRSVDPAPPRSVDPTDPAPLRVAVADPALPRATDPALPRATDPVPPRVALTGPAHLRVPSADSALRPFDVSASSAAPPSLRTCGAETEGVPEGEPVPPPMTYVRPPWWRFVCALSSETTDNRSIHVIALLLFCVLKNTSFLSFLKEKATRFKVPPRFTAGLLLGVAAFTFLFDAAVMGKDLNEVCTYLRTFADELKEESLKAKIQDDQVDITNIEE